MTATRRRSRSRRRDRWQPLRAGLVDLFYYDVEEFRFRDGRLLLRGNNGTGKSKVLALTLPFLLDGDLAAAPGRAGRRPEEADGVEPAARRRAPASRSGSATPGSSSAGSTEDGTAEFRTLGCGLKAVAGRGIARHWFFVTDQRVGPQLQLVDATAHRAHPRPAHRGARRARGRCTTARQDYRRAVDEALFGLGEQRYEALVDLLIQLRQPQLSKRPSEKALSDALTEALPPLDQAVVADVAEAFRGLEEERDELAAMTEAHGSAQAFLGHYRRYAAVAARRRAERPRHAEQRYRTAREALAAAEEAYRLADEAAAAAQERLGALAEEAERLQARDRSLRTGPEMRSAHELERLADEARRRRDDADAAAGLERRAAADVAKRRTRREDTASRTRAAIDELTELRGAARTAAEAARIGPEHAVEIDAHLPDGGADAPEPEHIVDERLRTLRRSADDLIARQERSIRHIEGLLTAESEAARTLVAARDTVERLASAMAALAERRSDAAAAVEQRGAELHAAVRAHLDTAAELDVPDTEGVLAALELWAGTLDGPNPARAAVDAAGRAATDGLARVGAGLDRRAADAAARAAELAAEIARLESGEHGAPPAPHTRDTAARAERAGAPLWQLVDFVDDVPDTERAGLEAALESSGILDAWLDPDGTLRDLDGDVLLAPEPSAPSPASPLSTRPATGRRPGRHPRRRSSRSHRRRCARGGRPGRGDSAARGSTSTAGSGSACSPVRGASPRRSTSGGAPVRPPDGRGSPRCGPRPSRWPPSRPGSRRSNAALAAAPRDVGGRDRRAARRHRPARRARHGRGAGNAACRTGRGAGRGRQRCSPRPPPGWRPRQRRWPAARPMSASRPTERDSTPCAAGVTQYRVALAGLSPAAQALAAARRSEFDAATDLSDGREVPRRSRRASRRHGERGPA